MNTPSPMVIEGFFDPKTSTVSYLLLDTLFMPDAEEHGISYLKIPLNGI